MRQRTSYPKPFKAQVVQECLRAGASIASVALSHGINANLVRKWIPVFREADANALPAFLPLKLEPTIRPDLDTSIRIEVPGARGKLIVNWPSSDPEGCARFVRGLMQ